MTMTEVRTATTIVINNATQLANVALFASKDQARPVLNAVLFEIGADERRMVATDSYALCIETLEHDEVDGPVGSWIVPLAAVLELAKRKSPRVTLTFSATEMTWTDHDTSGTVRLVDYCEFPNYRQLVSSDMSPTETVAIGAAMLARIAKARDTADPKNANPAIVFTFNGQLKPTQAKVGATTFILQMPSRV